MSETTGDARAAARLSEDEGALRVVERELLAIIEPKVDPDSEFSGVEHPSELDDYARGLLREHARDLLRALDTYLAGEPGTP